MGPTLTALLFAAGATTWVYTKLGRSSGYGNTRSVIIGSAAAGIVIFFVVWSLASMFLK